MLGHNLYITSIYLFPIPICSCSKNGGRQEVIIDHLCIKAVCLLQFLNTFHHHCNIISTKCCQTTQCHRHCSNGPVYHYTSTTESTFLMNFPVQLANAMNEIINPIMCTYAYIQSGAAAGETSSMISRPNNNSKSIIPAYN